METAQRTRLLDESLPPRCPAGSRSKTNGRRGFRAVQVIGLLAVASSALYLVSDIIEVLQGGFSTGQLWLTLVAEATVPIFVVGLWLVQRPRMSRLGAVSAIAYAYSYLFFTGTVVYALVDGTRDFEQLGTALDPWMTIHGAVMLFAGIGFGYAVRRAGVVPRWTGLALAAGVVLIPLSMGWPDAVALVGVGIRDLAFGAMGVALLLGSRSSPMGGTPSVPAALRRSPQDVDEEETALKAPVIAAKPGRTAVIVAEAAIRRSPEEVFDYCADHAHEPEWNIRMRGVQKLTDGPIGVGTRYLMEFTSGPPVISECVRFERPDVWEMIGRSRALTSGWRGTVERKGHAAHLVLRMEIQLRGVLGFAAPVLRRRMRPELVREIATIKAALERAGRPPLDPQLAPLAPGHRRVENRVAAEGVCASCTSTS